MKQFKTLNSIFGWITFIVASTVYLSTIEPTASFWDCGEFIATSFKMEVGHPPGDSFFEIMAKFFTLFAGHDLTKVPVMVNIMSALASGFTILLLFWSITHITRKIIFRNNDYSLGQSIAIIGAGLVGALAYTFSDSFWFSAVEGEVYASSSLFTALVFWLILKWEDRADDKHSSRLLVLIAYMMGLSIGVHLLNLLAIPAIVFVYYFKKYQVSTAGLVKASIISIVLLVATLYGVVQGLIYGAAYIDLFFVNDLGLPFYSGVFFYILAIIGLISWGLVYTYKKRKVLLNTIILIFTVLVLGYSSVAIIVIRSLANPPLDENDPENMFSLLYYLNREQYGDRPLLYGPVYNAQLDREKPYNEEGKPTYTPLNGRYEITNRKTEYNYDERFKMFFPRMFSPDADHIKAYNWWVKIKGTPIEATDNRGEPTTVYVPTFGENLKFFFKYQVNHMYFRYFMWNFSGRQNDMQGNGEVTKGNWISGIKSFDEWRLGPQDKLPETMSKNKGRNKYYMLPFLLGLIGMFYQYKRDKKGFTILGLLFFFTGLAIVLYLNQTPYQPRERDYAYVGSFYVFAMWIGIGVLSLYELLSQKIPSTVRAGAVTVICLAFVPAIMAKENWDDHDRSGRYTARDFAYDYLNSCDKDGIIFTNGDNDTFPLWYCQEVENVRPDVRIVNLSYLSADWYISQMERKCYDSDAVPFSLTKQQILQGKRDIVMLTDKIKDYVDIKDAINFVASDDPDTKSQSNYSEMTAYIPSKNFKMEVDTAAMFNSGYLSRDFAKKIVPQIKWSINRSYITKSDLMILDLLAHNNWKRPVYFAITVARENYLNLDNYFQICGLTYKLTPIYSEIVRGEISNIDTKTAYDNYMHKFKYGGVNNPKVYLDENNLRMLSNFRNGFSKLADALINEGKRDSALAVVEKGMKILPDNCVPYNFFMTNYVDLYYRLNKPDKANAIVARLGELMEGELSYFFRLKPEDRELIDYDIQFALYTLQQLAIKTKMNGHSDLSLKYEQLLEMYSNLYRPNN